MSSRTRVKARRPSIWSTASLRFAAAFSLLFGIGAAGLIVAVDYGLMRFAEAEVRDGLTHQMEVMRADADRHGSAALVRELNSQTRNRDARRYLLLVVAPDGQTFSNGLTRQAVNDTGFRRNLPTKMRQTRWPDQTPNMLVLSGHAQDGALLAVGRDTQHLDELRGGVRQFAFWSGLVLFVLAIVGGLTAGWLFLRRLEGVNNAVGRIIAGQEATRLPAIGFGREFDDLAQNLNRMLDRQEAAHTALKTLSEGVAHELRTPLTRVRNRLEDAAAHVGDPDRAADALDLAMQETDQLSSLFEGLLALARLESSGDGLKTVPVDAAALARTVCDIYRPIVEEGGGALNAPPDGALMVQGDPHLLQQALANLIENAVFHGGGDVQITVSVTQADGAVHLGVSDNGPGIPDDQHDRVLRRFHRLAPNTRSGSGLGLAMVAAVARAHGGAVRLSDNTPGLKVELILPIDS